MNWHVATLVESASNDLRNAELKGDGVAIDDINDALIRIEAAQLKLKDARKLLVSDEAK